MAIRQKIRKKDIWNKRFKAEATIFFLHQHIKRKTQEIDIKNPKFCCSII